MMYIPISKTSSKPAYQQLVEGIRKRILTGELKADEELPSIRQLAQDSQVSAITIRRAYSDVESEGLIYSRPGLGSFVASISTEKQEQMKLELIRPFLLELVHLTGELGLEPKEVEKMLSRMLYEKEGKGQ